MMKKKQVQMIFIDETRRKHRIIGCVFAILIIFVISLTFLWIYLNKNKSQYVKYTEKSNLDYKVYLKENQFFENKYLEKDNQYVSNLIDYIKADFDYNLKVEEKYIDYKYSYLIAADVTVKDKKTNKNLYHYTEELEKSDYETSHNISQVKLKRSLEIDYNKYNNLIRKFHNLYELSDTESTLNISMYVTVLGNCEDIKDPNKKSIITLSIPLTTKTIAIDMKYALVDENDVKLMKCDDLETDGVLYLITSIGVTFIDLIILVILIKYIVSSRTAQTIYDRELKKILNSYRSYIQKINNNFSLRGYQVLKVDTFTDMLEIRDTINEPILMVESSRRTGVFFIIPSKTKILYTFSLKVNDIKKKLEEEDEEF